MKKLRFTALLLSIAVMISVFPMTVTAAGGVSYIDENGVTQSYTDSITEVTSSDTEWKSGWYTVSGNVTIGTADDPQRVYVKGTPASPTYLILKDGATLTVNGGINVENIYALTIYAQSEGDRMGKLISQNCKMYKAGIGSEDKNTGAIIVCGGNITAVGGEYSAGIGGSLRATSGKIDIYGGIINATGGEQAAGIGGGCYANAGIINIHGGNVTATGAELGAGIGGGKQGAGGTITISGGTVNAKSTDLIENNTGSGAGIGGGDSAAGGTINITGGSVTATGASCYYGGNIYNGGSGIGGGNKGAGGTIKITDGSVIATGGGYAAGIGSGHGKDAGTITIEGGSVIATGGENAAGIGGGSYGSGGSITVKGGTVTAVGNGYYTGGIGNGRDGNRGSVTLDGGCITAVGGTSTGAYRNVPTLNADIGWKVSTGSSVETLAPVLAVDYSSSVFCSANIKAVKVEVCDPHDGDITYIDGEYHSVQCKWCSSGSQSGTKHSFDADGYCACGAWKGNCLVYSEEDGTWSEKAYLARVYDSTNTVIQTGRYVVFGDISVAMRIKIEGDTELILADGSCLTIDGGIEIEDGNSLTVYAQSHPVLNEDKSECETNRAGKAVIKNSLSERAAIGGNKNCKGGALTVHGGIISIVNDSDYSNSIGAGEGVTGCSVTVYGGALTSDGGSNGISGTLKVFDGNVTVKNSDQEGIKGNVTVENGTVTSCEISGEVLINGGNVTSIASGYNDGIGGNVTIENGTVVAKGGITGAGIGGNVTVNGGNVTAVGGGQSAGIGGRFENGELTVTINGGTIDATGGQQASGIGSGHLGASATVNITGGNITAKGGANAAGIGTGYSRNPNTIIISGGTVYAKGGLACAGIGGYFGETGYLTVTGGTVNSEGGDSDGIITAHGVNAFTTVTGGTLISKGSKYFGEESQPDGRAYDFIPQISNEMRAYVGDSADVLSGVEIALFLKGYYLNAHYVKICACDEHTMAVGFKDASCHVKTCIYCDYSDEQGEPHAYDENGVCSECNTWHGDYLAFDENGNAVTKQPDCYVEVVTPSTMTFKTGWYVVTENTEIKNNSTDRAAVNGKVNLILTDGATLTFVGGLTVLKSASLTVWAQSEGAGAGAIVADGSPYGLTAKYYSAIGGGKTDEQLSDCGDIIFNGGNITAFGACGGIGDAEGTVTVNAGTVSASGRSFGFASTDIVINGGAVTAQGGSMAFEKAPNVSTKGRLAVFVGKGNGIYRGVVRTEIADAVYQNKAIQIKDCTAETHFASGTAVYKDEDFHVVSCCSLCGEENIEVAHKFNIAGYCTDCGNNSLGEGYVISLGDVDSDGLLTLKDMKLLRKYAIGSVGQETLLEYNADIDADGVVGAKDIKLLAKLMTGGDTSSDEQQSETEITES